MNAKRINKRKYVIINVVLFLNISDLVAFKQTLLFRYSHKIKQNVKMINLSDMAIKAREC